MGTQSTWGQIKNIKLHIVTDIKGSINTPITHKGAWVESSADREREREAFSVRIRTVARVLRSSVRWITPNVTVTSKGSSRTSSMTPEEEHPLLRSCSGTRTSSS